MPKVLKQGESYEADKENSENVEAGPEKDLNPVKNDKVKYIAIIAVAVLIVIVLLAILVMKNINKADEDYDPYAVEESDDSSDNAASDLLNSSLSGDTDTTLTEPQDTADVQGDVEALDTYDTEAFELRKRGYTADEIEFARNNGISYDTMIQKADEDIRKQQEAVLAELSDQGSEAYQTLLNMTWLQGDDLVISDIEYDEYGSANTYSEDKTMNIDYVKVPAKGKQLWLKCDCREYGVNFMSVDPMRWLQLADSGNILVTVTVTYWNDTPVVTDIVEIDAGDREDYLQTTGGTE